MLFFWFRRLMYVFVCLFCSINELKGSQTVVKGSPHSKLKKTHGLMNMFGWGIIIIIGAIVARHMKQWDPTWFYTHIALQITGFLLGLTGIICGLVLENRTNASNVSTHKALGITILVMGILQVHFLLTLKIFKYTTYGVYYQMNIGLFGFVCRYYRSWRCWLDLTNNRNTENIGIGIITT